MLSEQLAIGGTLRILGAVRWFIKNSESHSRHLAMSHTEFRITKFREKKFWDSQRWVKQNFASQNSERISAELYRIPHYRINITEFRNIQHLVIRKSMFKDCRESYLTVAHAHSWMIIARANFSYIDSSKLLHYTFILVAMISMQDKVSLVCHQEDVSLSSRLPLLLQTGESRYLNASMVCRWKDFWKHHNSLRHKLILSPSIC